MVNEGVLLDAISDIILTSLDTKKRVFNQAKLVVNDNGQPKTIYLTLSAEPAAYSGTIFLGDDTLLKKEDQFTASTVEQCRLVEASLGNL